MLSDADIKACADNIPDSLMADHWLYAFARAIEAMVLRKKACKDDWRDSAGDMA